MGFLLAIVTFVLFSQNPVFSYTKCQTTDYKDIYARQPLIDNQFYDSKSTDDCVTKCFEHNQKRKPYDKECRAINFLKKDMWCGMHYIVMTNFSAGQSDTYQLVQGATYAVIRSCTGSSGNSSTSGSGSNSTSVGCGRAAGAYTPSGLRSTARIINGQEAKPHSWPFSVTNQVNKFHFCGGSLLRVRDNLEESDMVLTAGHCVGGRSTEDPATYNGWNVVAGLHKKYAYDTKGMESRAVVAGRKHENYKSAKNDVAVLRLASPIKFSDTIRPICLPDKGEPIPVGRLCVSVGWGRNETNSQKSSEALQQLKVPVHNPIICMKRWTSSNYIESQMLCAGGLDGRAGVCNGDSGGILMCQANDGRWVQYGIVSYVGGKGKCIEAGWPAVFARVSSYSDWIKKAVKDMTKL